MIGPGKYCGVLNEIDTEGPGQIMGKTKIYWR